MKLPAMTSAWIRSRLRGGPFSCNLKITERCNLRCRMCSIWRRGDAAREMDFHALQRVCLHLKELGLGRVVITGGEPLLRPDVTHIVRLFARSGMSTTLLTNGTLLRPNTLSQLAHAGLQDLGISLDSLRPEVEDDLCQGSGVLDRILRILPEAVERLPRGIVQVMITVTPDNLNEVPEIVRWADSIGAYSVVNPVNLPANQSANRLLSGELDPFAGRTFPRDQVNRLYDELQTLKRQGIRLLVSNRFLAASREYLLTGNYAFRCHAGKHYFTIFSDGSVAACSDLSPSLSALDRDFVRQFTSRKTQDELAAQRLQCEGCIYSCWREISYLLYDPRTLAERAILGGRLALRAMRRRTAT